MSGRLFSLICALSFAGCAAASILWAATHARGISVARWGMQTVEYRLICGHGMAQLAAVPFVRPTASPFSSDETTRLGCTLSQWTIDGHHGWAVSVPLAYVVAVSAILPVVRLAAWLRRKRRLRYQPALCRICGYDLRAGNERCPECGTVVASPAGGPRPATSQRPL